MATSTGHDPAISAVTGQRVNQFHHEAILYIYRIALFSDAHAFQHTCRVGYSVPSAGSQLILSLPDTDIT